MKKESINWQDIKDDISYFLLSELNKINKELLNKFDIDLLIKAKILKELLTYYLKLKEDYNLK